MTKTMSIRMDKENFEFVSRLSKQEKGDISKTVRDLVYKGRVMIAIEKYKNGEASLGKAAEPAGLSRRRHHDHPGAIWSQKQP